MKYLTFILIAVVICCYECTAIADKYQMEKLDLATKSKLENANEDQLIRISIKINGEVNQEMINKLKDTLKIKINTITYSVITAECTKAQILRLSTFPFIKRIESERKIELK